VAEREPLKLAVLVSGLGSNLQSIIDQIETGHINAEIVCVISNRPEAAALARAARHNIPTITLESSCCSSRHEYDSKLVGILKSYNAELVVLAGFMRIVSEVLINAFPNAIMNIHPALLPAFPGLNAQKQALDYGVRLTGCTVHFVDCGTDTGPIILQSAVPVAADDSIESLSARIQTEEHSIYPEAIRLFADGRLQVEGRQVHILP
jgi:phosphoribosylglycinamide formyltransferase 1